MLGHVSWVTAGVKLSLVVGSQRIMCLSTRLERDKQHRNAIRQSHQEPLTKKQPKNHACETFIAGDKPLPRMGHTAVQLGSSMIVFGGRDSPARPLSDVWLLDTATWHWQHVACTTSGPCARFRHAAVATGCDLQVTLCCHILHFHSVTLLGTSL